MTYSTCEASKTQLAPQVLAAVRPAGSIVARPRTGPNSAASDEQIVRERSRAGSIFLDRRDVRHQQSASAKVTTTSALIVVPEEGRITILAEGDMWAVEPGQIALLARPQHMTLVWSAGARGDVLSVRRDRLQSCASNHFGEPRRLAAVVKLFEADEAFGEALAALKAGATSAKPRIDVADSGIETSFYCALIALGERMDLASELFLDVRSAREAIAYVRANHHADCSAVSLAAIVGVTERTLRERFRQCLGVSIAGFVQDVRLDWARARLVDAHESRSIGQLALSAGFATAGSFSKAYLRRFGEPAMHTRMRAVGKSGASQS